MLIDAADESDLIGTSLPKCINCDQQLETAGNFCPHCGCAQITNDPGVAIVKWNSIRKIILFFLIDAVICCVFSFIKVFHTLFWSITTDILLAVVAVTFFVLNWSSY